MDVDRSVETNEDMDTMREINPLTVFIKVLAATFNLKKDCGLVVQRQARTDSFSSFR